jgi:hypothetical protein
MKNLTLSFILIWTSFHALQCQKYVLNDEAFNLLVEQKDKIYQICNYDKPYYRIYVGNEDTLGKNSYFIPMMGPNLCRNNFMPWDISNDGHLYFVTQERYFQHSYYFRLYKIPLSHIEEGKNFEDLRSLAEWGGLFKYSIKVVNNFHWGERKFNVDELDSIYYDFAVANDNIVTFASVFQKELVVQSYNQSDKTWTKVLKTKTGIDEPFRIVWHEGKYYIITGNLSVFRIEEDKISVLEGVDGKDINVVAFLNKDGEWFATDLDELNSRNSLKGLKLIPLLGK